MRRDEDEEGRQFFTGLLIGLCLGMALWAFIGALAWWVMEW